MDVEGEIGAIRSRNRRVEADKAWETSYARRAIITIGTYVFSYALLVLIQAPNPLLAALVPAMGFLFSTLTLPLIKDAWLRSRK